MKIVVVDIHPIVAYALANYLQKIYLCTISSAFSKDDALSFIYRDNFDVVIIDLVLRDENGFDVIKATLEGRHTKFIAFTNHYSKEYVTKFFEVGGNGFVSKSSSLDTLVDAINAVSIGTRYISPDIQHNNEIVPLSKLSEREYEVITLLAKGYSNQQAADKLFVSINTIRTHRLRIFQKLDIHSIVELSSYFHENKMALK